MPPFFVLARLTRDTRQLSSIPGLTGVTELSELQSRNAFPSSLLQDLLTAFRWLCDPASFSRLLNNEEEMDRGFRSHPFKSPKIKRQSSSYLS